MASSSPAPTSADPHSTGAGSGYLNTDTLSKSGKVVRRAITGNEQLKNILTRLEQENHERSTKNARIMSRYNAEQPYNQSELTNQGLNWKSNFSTRPLASIIDRLAPRYVRAVQGMRYVTNSKLRITSPDAHRKTEFYRKELTSLLRGHRKWKPLITQLAQENALFGYAACGILDEVSWMPRFFRQDEFFVPLGTGQHSDEAQIVVFREDCLPSELFSRIEDKEVAEDSGWEIEPVVKAINEAKPVTPNDSYQHSYRSYQDMQREGATAFAHSGGANSVKLHHVLAVETTGKVSHYITAGDNKELVFKRVDRFERMSDAVTFFTFQQGNGRIHGSLGVGRICYNLAAVVDRARCEVVDRHQLSSKILLSCDPGDIARFQMSVVGSAALIGDNFKIQQQKLESGVDEFLQLDQFIEGLMNEAAGNVTPNSANLQGERVTAAAVNLVAGREEELRDIRLERFIDAFSDMVSSIQRRVFDEDVAEADRNVREFRKRILKMMTLEEFRELSECPASETVEDFTEDERQRMILSLKEWANDPFVDAQKVRRRLADLQLGEDVATDILLSEEDPKVVQLAQRQQLTECLLLDSGVNPPVVASDNHKVHWQILQQAMQNLTPEQLQVYGAHATAHAQASGDPAFVAEVRGVIASIVEQQQAAPPAAPAAMPPEAMPPEAMPPAAPEVMPPATAPGTLEAAI